MGMIDLIVLITIIISVLFALYRGLLRELLGISSWILAGIGALYAYQPLFDFLTNKVEKVRLWTISGAVLTALVILILMTILNARITKKLRKSSLSGLDRILGVAFGVARAGLLIVLVWLFTSQMVFSSKQIKNMAQENISVPYIQQLAEKTEKILPENILDDLTPKPTPDKEVKKPVVEYKEADRKALENMVESIVEIEELE